LYVVGCEIHSPKEDEIEVVKMSHATDHGQRTLEQEEKEIMTGWPIWTFRVAGLWGFLTALLCFHPSGFLQSLGGAGVGVLRVTYAEEKGEAGSVTKLRIEPLYKAARLSWRANIDTTGPLTFEIYRSQASPEGPYTKVTSIEWQPEVKNYRYVDKNLPVEENYFYKIEIPATKESYGPLQVRPPFSLPTT
jgi:hypothetical protein